jgi:hypothetical protein
MTGRQSPGEPTVTGTDRIVHRASDALADGECLVASAAGREADGRRRGAVLVTDRRVLVVWRRGAPTQELSLDDATAQRSDPGALLSIAGPGVEVTLRDVEPDAADQVVGVLSEHRPRSRETADDRAGHVRLVTRLSDADIEQYRPLDELTDR